MEDYKSYSKEGDLIEEIKWNPELRAYVLVKDGKIISSTSETMLPDGTIQKEITYTSCLFPRYSNPSIDNDFQIEQSRKRHRRISFYNQDGTFKEGIELINGQQWEIKYSDDEEFKKTYTFTVPQRYIEYPEYYYPENSDKFAKFTHSKNGLRSHQYIIAQNGVIVDVELGHSAYETKQHILEKYKHAFNLAQELHFDINFERAEYALKLYEANI